MPAASSQCTGSSALLNLANYAESSALPLIVTVRKTGQAGHDGRFSICWHLLALSLALRAMAPERTVPTSSHERLARCTTPSCRKHLLQSTEWGIMRRTDVICGELQVPRRRARPGLGSTGPGSGEEPESMAESCWAQNQPAASRDQHKTSCPCSPQNIPRCPHD